MDFNNKYNQIKLLAQSEILSIENFLTEGILVKEPLNTILKRFLLSPSKRIRPLLCILYAKANDETLNQTQLKFLSVIELIHNASLIHDDIIDESSIRRGGKTISAEFDNKMGVISGDYLLAIAMEHLTQINNIEIIKKVSQTIKHMCIGEINQNFDRYKIGTIENYIEKTKNKTAYLFETALTCCMMLSENAYNYKEINNIGLNIGIAFQIRDDIINFTCIDTSKPTKNDLEEGIYNAPVILGTENDNYTSGIEKSKILLNNYIKAATDKINYLPGNKYKEALNQFMELIKNV